MVGSYCMCMLQNVEKEKKKQHQWDADILKYMLSMLAMLSRGVVSQLWESMQVLHGSFLAEACLCWYLFAFFSLKWPMGVLESMHSGAAACRANRNLIQWELHRKYIGQPLTVSVHKKRYASVMMFIKGGDPLFGRLPQAFSEIVLASGTRVLVLPEL